MTHPEWTDDEVERLRELWSEGVSSSKIAEILAQEFGRDLTRNSVITKADRLNLSEESRREPSRPEPKCSGTASFQEERIAPLKTCRWPIGDPGSPNFSYCGAGVEKGDSFCETHKKSAYQPKKPRKKAEATARAALDAIAATRRINF